MYTPSPISTTTIIDMTIQYYEEGEEEEGIRGEGRGRRVGGGGRGREGIGGGGRRVGGGGGREGTGGGEGRRVWGGGSGGVRGWERM